MCIAVSPIAQPFPALWLSHFIRMYSISIAFGVISISFGVISQDYGVNSKGLRR